MDQMKDRMGVVGTLRLQVRRRGVLLDVWEEENVVVDIPRAEIASRLAGAAVSVLPITHIAVGTSDSSPDQGDTAITDAFVKPLISVTNPLPTVVEAHFLIATDEAVGKAITEFGLLRSDNSLFARRTRGLIEKDGELEIEGLWTVRL